MTRSLGERSLYLCTPMRHDLESFVGHCVEGGVDVVQLRDKDHDDRELLAAATSLASLCRSLGVPFLVNDRSDLAVLSGADGVHVGQDDVRPEDARSIVGPDAIVGLSTHADDELARGCAAPVTYLSAGPVVATPTKPGREGTGLEYVAHAVATAPVPVFVTGGVTTATIPALAAAGVRRFVVVRALTEADDPRAAATALRGAIDAAVGRA